MLAYKLDDQTRIVVASITIHNHIKKHNEKFDKVDHDDD